MGHFANIYRLSNRSQGQAQHTQRFLQKKPPITVRQQQSPRTALSRSEFINLMSANACIYVTEFGIVDYNFDNISWLASLDITNNPATNQTTYEAKDTIMTAVHSIQRSQAYTREYMVPEDTIVNRSGLDVEVKL